MRNPNFGPVLALIPEHFNAAGLETHTVRKTLAANKHYKIARSIYLNLDSLSPEPWQIRRNVYLLRCYAALQQHHTDAVWCYESAAYMWNLYSWADKPDVHIAKRQATQTRYSRLSLPAIPEQNIRPARVRNHKLRLCDEDLVEHQGYFVTSLPRTIVDTACRAHPMHAYVAVCAGIRMLVNPQKGESTPTLQAREAQVKTALQAKLAALHSDTRMRGFRQGRAVIRAASGLCESPLEAAFSWAWLAHGYPDYLRQHEFGWNVMRPFRVDAFLPDKNVVIELDGRSKYRRDEDLIEQRDRERQIALQGYRVIRIISKDVMASMHMLRTATELYAQTPRPVKHLWALPATAFH